MHQNQPSIDYDLVFIYLALFLLLSMLTLSIAYSMYLQNLLFDMGLSWDDIFGQGHLNGRELYNLSRLK